MMDEQAAKLIVGNWKMHGEPAFVDALMQQLSSAPLHNNATMVVCPPTIWIDRAYTLAGGKIAMGAQDCSAQPHGAHTGDVNAEMLKSSHCSYVIVGHSERREHHAETDTEVSEKAQAAIAAGLIPILCVGESLQQREAGEAETVVVAQMQRSMPQHCESIIIAYEPIWAIGTGKLPTTNDIASMHKAIHTALSAEKGDDFARHVLYGGSVKPNNANEILHIEGVDGALVGGASLQADSFLRIYEAA